MKKLLLFVCSLVVISLCCAQTAPLIKHLPYKVDNELQNLILNSYTKIDGTLKSSTQTLSTPHGNITVTNDKELLFVYSGLQWVYYHGNILHFEQVVSELLTPDEQDKLYIKDHKNLLLVLADINKNKFTIKQ